jgi:hypothetical protein
MRVGAAVALHPKPQTTLRHEATVCACGQDVGGVKILTEFLRGQFRVASPNARPRVGPRPISTQMSRELPSTPKSRYACRKPMARPMNRSATVYGRREPLTAPRAAAPSTRDRNRKYSAS